MLSIYDTEQASLVLSLSSFIDIFIMYSTVTLDWFEKWFLFRSYERDKDTIFEYNLDVEVNNE